MTIVILVEVNIISIAFLDLRRKEEAIKDCTNEI